MTAAGSTTATETVVVAAMTKTVAVMATVTTIVTTTMAMAMAMAADVQLPERARAFKQSRVLSALALGCTVRSSSQGVCEGIAGHGCFIN